MLPFTRWLEPDWPLYPHLGGEVAKSSFPDCYQAVTEISVDAVVPLGFGERRIASTAVISEPSCLLPPNDFFALCGSAFERHSIGVRHLAVQRRQFGVLADETLNRRRGLRAVEARRIGSVHRL